MEKVRRIAREEKRSKSRRVLIALTTAFQQSKHKQILSPFLSLLILATSLLALGGSSLMLC